MPHAHLEASLSIAAPAHAVFARMNDLSRFSDWNPFPAMDASTVSRHEGPAAGPGASFSYEGDRLGKGRMEIVAVDEPHRIDIAMTFWRGKTVSHSKAAFVVCAEAGTTTVRWTFDEDRSFGMYLLGKLAFDRMMTRTFLDGLKTLKGLVESELAATA